MTFITLIVLLVINTTQAGWIKDYGSNDPLSAYGFWIEETEDLGYIMTGAHSVFDTSGSIVFDQLYLIKTDSQGDTLWTRTYGGDWELESSGRCVQETFDGGYIVSGDANMSPFLVKTDPEGDTMWMRIYEGQGHAYCVRQISDGFVITGDKQNPWTLGLLPWSNDLFCEKVDFEGNSLWSRSFGTEEDIETGFSLQVTTDGGFIIAGNGPEKGLWIIKTDSSGETKWSRAYKLGQEDKSDEGRCIEATADGGWIVTGGMDYDVINNGSLFVLKLDSLGDTSWTRIYNFGSRVEAGLSVKQTPDFGYIVLGQKNYSMQGTGAIWLLKTDSLGDTLWTRTYGGNPQDRGDCIQLTPDGGYIITGFTKSYSSNGSIQVLLMKTDSLGNVDIEESYPGFSDVRWEIQTAVGPVVTLRYFDCPEGFHAEVFDASGRKVDEIQFTQQSGMITWGDSYSPGVYFIREVTNPAPAQKVVLVR